MNYFNPYFYSLPTFSAAPRIGLFSRLFNGINFSSILNGTQRTLNVINQTIPLVKQAGPVIKNAKTMFKVMNEFKKDDNEQKIETKKEVNQNIGPTFFL